MDVLWYLATQQWIRTMSIFSKELLRSIDLSAPNQTIAVGILVCECVSNHSFSFEIESKQQSRSTTSAHTLTHLNHWLHAQESLYKPTARWVTEYKYFIWLARSRTSKTRWLKSTNNRTQTTMKLVYGISPCAGCDESNGNAHAYTTRLTKPSKTSFMIERRKKV